MKYFEKFVKTLYSKAKDVLTQDEVIKFLRLFGANCTFESLPRQFTLLIQLAVYLLNKIQALIQDEKDDDDRAKPMKQTDISQAESNIRTRCVKPYSSLNDTNLTMASLYFS